MFNFINNKKGSAVLVIVFLSLMGFFSLTILASDVIRSNLKMSKAQLNSTKAYFAAEVGLEQALWSVMGGDYDLPEESTKKVFSNNNVTTVKNFLKNGVYNVDYNKSNTIRTFLSTGGYSTQHRSTEVSFCIPDCFEKKCGASDGCDKLCPETCQTKIGCRVNAPAETSVVDGTDGACCNSEKCYECREGFVWNGTACVYDCVQQCQGLSCGELDSNCGKPCPGSCESNPGCIANTSPAPDGTVASTNGTCCAVSGINYTCYECAEGFGWNGNNCEKCNADAGKAYPGTTNCYDAGIYDCFGHQVLPEEQITKGTSCSGGVAPKVSLGMNEGMGLVAYDSTVNNNDAVFEGNKWSFRKEIIIKHEKFPVDLADFQFLLYIPKDNDLYYEAQDSGADILFRDSYGNTIPHEIEYFQSSILDSPTMGRLIAWLRVPQIYSAQDTKIYMYFGNMEVGSQQNPAAVWKEYKGVWHLDDGLDSSSQLANLGWYGMGVYPNQVDSMIYKGQYDSVSVYNHYFQGMSYTSGTYLSSYDDTTISAWVKPSAPYPDTLGYLFATNWNYMSNDPGQGIRFLGNYPLFYKNNSTFSLNSGKNLNDGKWHHIAYVVKNAPGTCFFYVDGEIASSATGCPGVTPDSSYDFMVMGHSFYNFFGSAMTQQGQVSYNGSADEVRFAFYPFSHDYIKASYQNQLDPVSYVSIGEMQNLGAGLANWTSSIYDLALEFNGSSNYLSFPTGGTIPLNASMTLEAWVYPYKMSNMEIASKWGDSWGWYLNATGQQCLYLRRSNSTTQPFVCSTSSVAPSIWTHLSVIFNKVSGQVIFYNNGIASAPISTPSLSQGTAGSLKISGTDTFSSYAGYFAVSIPRFNGKIDEFNAYDYIRTAVQIQGDANKNVCNGDGDCVVLSGPEPNSGTYQSCNDICYAEGKICSSVGTDSVGTNRLMSVYSGGFCSSIFADCSTVVERNPEEATPFLCGGKQTNWTNCNCTICDLNFGSPCAGNSCIVPDTGMTACDGTCVNPTYVPSGSSCGLNQECDGLGTCRSVCHPLIGKPCGEDQCNNAGVISCEGFCEGITPKKDSLVCENTDNDPYLDQCWGGECTQCDENVYKNCNVGECTNSGKTDCFGGCSACVDNDCVTNPNNKAPGTTCDAGVDTAQPYSGLCDAWGVCQECSQEYLEEMSCNTGTCQNPGEYTCNGGCDACTYDDCNINPSVKPTGTWCDSGYGSNTGLCEGVGYCKPCHADYLSMGPTCPAQTCRDVGTRSCVTGQCPTPKLLPVNSYCLNAGRAGSCDTSGTCIVCEDGYRDPCNNTTSCYISGTILCDGVTCSKSGYLNEGAFCNAGLIGNWAYPNTGYCNAAHFCLQCDTKYLNQQSCNTGTCQVAGKYTCEGGCDACDDDNCVVNPENKPAGSTCSTGAVTAQAYSGTCNASGACMQCDQKFLDGLSCNTGPCQVPGKYTCDGGCDACKDNDCITNPRNKVSGATCSTGVATVQAYSGICNSSGTCVQCDNSFLNSINCNTGTCQNVGKYTCSGGCTACVDGDCVTNPNIKEDGTTCSTGAVTTQPYSGICDSGVCEQCDQKFLSAQSCNATQCHIPGVYDCVGNCSTGTTIKPVNTPCNAGFPDAHYYPNTGYCSADGSCLACTEFYNYKIACKPTTGDSECWNSGEATTCLAECNSTPKPAGTTCNVDGLASALPYTGKCDGAGNCSKCTDVYLNKTACNDQTCHVASTYNCEGTCLSTAYMTNGTWCNAGASYSGSARNPNTGQCSGGACSVCSNDYLYNFTNCYPAGVTDANKPCYNPQTVSSCYATCTASYKAVGIPCGGGNECNGAGLCTTPYSSIILPNLSSTGLSCQNVCQSLPYSGRVCADIGNAPSAADNIIRYEGFGGWEDIGGCNTPVYNWGDHRRYTYCQCRNDCVADFGKECRPADACNARMTYQCNGDCPASYIANNTVCDPAGESVNGYCWYGTCNSCLATPGTPCNNESECLNAGTYNCQAVCSTFLTPYKTYGTSCDPIGASIYGYCSSGTCNTCSKVPGSGCNIGECLNAGTYNCYGDCSASANPYKVAGTVCGGTGTCDGKGVCAIPSPLYGKSCPITPPKDSECYIPGTWDFYGTTCVNPSNINADAVCTVNATEKEGRCSAGNCVACSILYNTNCNVPSPYHPFCYSNGVYNCFATVCSTAYIKNNGLGGCSTDEYICDTGQCVVGVVGSIYLNTASGKTCNQICEDHSMRCYSVGYDSLGNDGNYSTYISGDKTGGSCSISYANCSTIMSYNGSTCDAHNTNWTNCNCTNCNVKAWTSCETDAMYAGKDYDSECYNFGTYTCAGVCQNYGVKNEGSVCTKNATGLEGRCTSGVCSQCADTYLNKVLCDQDTCANRTRECNGSCTVSINLGVGESCGEGLECTEAGACVSATLLPDIVVPNRASGQSCNVVCSGYTNRTCESIGTDGTQAGGTNGKGFYYGLSDEVATCISQTSYCSTIFSRSPSLSTNPYYGYTCNGTFTDWTYCRCTNQ